MFLGDRAKTTRPRPQHYQHRRRLFAVKNPSASRRQKKFTVAMKELGYSSRWKAVPGVYVFRLTGAGIQQLPRLLTTGKSISVHSGI